MRWVCIVALLAGHAGVPPAAHADDTAGDFWLDVIEPHGATVAAIVTRARDSLDRLDGTDGDPDGKVERRASLLGDVYRRLRHARGLSPENTAVLSLLGRVADDLGKTRQALDALEACARIEGAGLTADVAGRLGMIYLRLGKLDDAIRWLRHAQGPLVVSEHAVAAVHLATALAARGQMSDAIDVLANALPAQTNYFTDPITLVSLALAVHYDRDDQRGAAFDRLDKMEATLQRELGPFAHRALEAMRFAPPEDRYYYQALLHEMLGHYAEARTEWALYAATDAPWRARALEHIRDIDAQRAASSETRTARPSVSIHKAVP